MKEKEFKIKTMKEEEEIKRQKKLKESMKPALIKNKIKMESKVKKFLENFEESTKNHFIETIKKRANTPDFELKSQKIDQSFQQLKGTIRKDLFKQ
jgi:rRNA maturation protein Rpf1